jgi:hypothetical protein
MKIHTGLCTKEVSARWYHYHIKKNEMGWVCGAYDGGERCAQGAGGEA